jgi:hypothetical protein
MKEMEKHKVPVTIDFCNTLIKQRALRFDYEGAKVCNSYLTFHFISLSSLLSCVRSGRMCSRSFSPITCNQI